MFSKSSAGKAEEMSLTNEYRTGPIAGVPAEILECFPPNGAMHAYLWWASQTTDAPAWFHVASILPAAAMELARRGYCIGEEMRLPPRIWTTMVAGPGVGKSTALNTARGFYTEASARFGYLEDGYITAEGSTQGLFEAIAQKHDQQRDTTCAILVREEFSVLLNARRRDELSTALCEWADGAYHERHTRGHQQARARGEVVHDRMDNAVISASFVTTERGLYDVATSGHMEGGLFSRILWFKGRSSDIVPKLHQARRALERGVALSLWNDWQKWLDAEEALSEGKIIQVSKEVHSILEQSLFKDYAEALKRDDRLTASYKRGLNHAYAVAAIYAVSCGRLAVAVEDMERAVKLLAYCISNLTLIEPEIGATPLMKGCNVAFNLIRAAGDGGLTRTPIYRRLQIPKFQLEQVIDTLKDEGSIRVWEPAPGAKRKPGRPTERYVAVSDRRFIGAKQAGKVIRFKAAKGVDAEAASE